MLRAKVDRGHNRRVERGCAPLFLSLSIGLSTASCTERRAEPDAAAELDATGTATAAAELERRPPAPPPPPIKTLVEDRGDLAEIKRRGTLRALISGDAEALLPASGRPVLDDLEALEAFAARLGVALDITPVDDHSTLIPMLLSGKGDLVAAQLTITASRSREVAFGVPIATTSEMLVGRRGAPDLPAQLAALDGRRISVRGSSSYFETLELLRRTKLPRLDLERVPETEDDEEILGSVARGERTLTVIDRGFFEAVAPLTPGVAPLFEIADRRRIAWAVRPDNPRLRAAVDAFWSARHLTAHRAETYRADLAEIKRRGVLRVLTRNGPTSYFLHRGRQVGFDYEIARLFAERLGVRLEIVIPPERSQLIPWLLEGRGDLIAASMTVTPARAAEVRFSRPYLFVDEVLVGAQGAESPTSLEALAGKTVVVRRGSSHLETLRDLERRGIAVKIVEAPEEDETSALIAQVAAGEIAYTVADSHHLAIERAYGVPVEAGLVLTPHAEPSQRGARAIAFAIRPTDRALLAAASTFVEGTYRGLEYNLAHRRYFEVERRGGSARLPAAGPAKTGTISPYDALFRRYGERYHLDWRLIAAQAFVESGFDPKAKSWVGALGLMQVMPRTGAELGFTRLEDPEIGVHAGVLYLSRLIERVDARLPFRQRVRLALAGYNAGMGHVADARRIARLEGWDPDRWFGHVERAMLLLEKPAYARKAASGYCRGREPVDYVSRIQTLYDAYVSLVPE